MKELLKKLSEAEAKTNALDELLEENPDDVKLNDEWLKAYTDEFNLYTELGNMLLKILKAHGMKDATRSTVNKMIVERRKELERLAEMM